MTVSVKLYRDDDRASPQLPPVWCCTRMMMVASLVRTAQLCRGLLDDVQRLRRRIRLQYHGIRDVLLRGCEAVPTPDLPWTPNPGAGGQLLQLQPMKVAALVNVRAGGSASAQRDQHATGENTDPRLQTPAAIQKATL